MTRAVAPVLFLIAVACAACTGSPAATPVVSATTSGGIGVATEVSASGHSLVVEVRVTNERGEPLHLVPDQCGRVTEALLARAVPGPTGREWSGSVGTLKNMVLGDQAFAERPDRFHPRRPGSTSSEVPACSRPEAPLALAPGATIEERWELPFPHAGTLDAVGSAASYVRVEAVEARSATDVEYLDFQWEGMADDDRAGRNVRVEIPVDHVLDRAAPASGRELTLGQLFDVLMSSQQVHDWIASQPADGWRLGDLIRAGRDGPGITLRAITTAYERPAEIVAGTDGQPQRMALPTEADRTRVFERRPATLPPGVPLIEEEDAGVPTEDVLLPSVRLPSGRVVVGEYLLDAAPLPFEVAPGAYPAHATLVHYADGDFESVALLSLVVSDAETVRWEASDAIAVDGGTMTITSPEGVQAMRETFDRDQDEWWRESETVWASLAAHDHLVTEADIDGRADLVMSSSGFGDGGYPVYIGRDETGRATRVVVDFLLIHLGWPVPEAP